MEEQHESKHHYAITSGGKSGHYVRRLIHLGMLLIPFLYYYLGGLIFADNVALENKVMMGIFLAVLLGEAFRLSQRLVFYGQREWERERISSGCWGLASIIIVLLFAPGNVYPEIAYTLPIIGACALVDPMIGEMRIRKINNFTIVVSALVVIAVLWLLSSWIYAIPWWLALIMAPLAVLGEYVKLSWIDDNATMMLLPFICVLFLNALL